MLDPIYPILASSLGGSLSIRRGLPRRFDSHGFKNDMLQTARLLGSDLLQYAVSANILLTEAVTITWPLSDNMGMPQDILSTGVSATSHKLMENLTVFPCIS